MMTPMPISLLRFNFVLPGRDPQTLSDMYRAGIEMAEYVDDRGFMAVTLEEHHGVDDGWSPAPLTTAGMMLARTANIRVMVQALLVPLNDPIRVAEQIAVLDLASNGRISVVAGLGYRPEEYAAAGADWKGRGKVMDASLDAILQAWTGEEFEHNGATVRVTPTPKTPAAGLLFVGGSGKPAARRAARLGLPFLPAAHLPELQSYYEEQCKEQGTSPFAILPPEDTSLIVLAEDPDEGWRAMGEHLLHEATRYQSWQTPDVHSAVASHASTVEELRAEGIYQVLSPDELIERCKKQGDFATVVLHPLCGGIPVERGWETVRLYTDKVLPALS
jgi:alkanesulfonate monooxygenase SsuD/methylene tetrahydromethanopterin reductase-like flavin-dependent oxidoreductase (luciferase family)